MVTDTHTEQLHIQHTRPLVHALRVHYLTNLQQVGILLLQLSEGLHNSTSESLILLNIDIVNPTNSTSALNSYGF